MSHARIALVLWMLRWIPYGTVAILVGRELAESVYTAVVLALVVIFFPGCGLLLCLPLLVPLAFALVRVFDHINRHP